MNHLIKHVSVFRLSISNFSIRTICCSVVNGTKEWRMKQGLPVFKNSEGPLTDSPDYTFLDGRPTPLLHKQKLRMLRQRGFAEKIVESHEEIDFAVEREKNIREAEEKRRQNIISNRLKAKGRTLFNKK